MRKDIKVLKDLMAKGFISETILKTLIARPLIELHDEFDAEVKSGTNTEMNNLNIKSLFNHALTMPLVECSIYSEDTYVSYHYKPEQQEVYISAMLLAPGEEDNYSEIKLTVREGKVYTNIVKGTGNNMQLKPAASVGLEKLAKLIVAFFEWVEKRDLYQVEKRAIKPLSGLNSRQYKKRVRALDSRSTTIIYMNKLPGHSNGSRNTGSTKAPHQRRGFKYTLRSERYKRHPMYQVEKGMYRKPAWIGERIAEYMGNTYTVK